MKTMILYYSKHHGNTKKLVDAIAAKHEVDTLNVAEGKAVDLSGYDRIGLASGIYAGNFGKPLLNYAKENLPEGKEVFFLYTSASGAGRGLPEKAKAAAEDKHCKIIGSYARAGFNTFGPFKIVGGTAKGHPTKEEIEGAVAFYESLQ